MEQLLIDACLRDKAAVNSFGICLQGQSTYSRQIKQVEDDIQQLLKKINELTGMCLLYLLATNKQNASYGKFTGLVLFFLLGTHFARFCLY